MIGFTPRTKGGVLRLIGILQSTINPQLSEQRYQIQGVEVSLEPRRPRCPFLLFAFAG